MPFLQKGGFYLLSPYPNTLKKRESKALRPNLPFFPSRGEGILECSNKTCKTPFGLFGNQLKASSSGIPKTARLINPRFPLIDL